MLKKILITLIPVALLIVVGIALSFGKETRINSIIKFDDENYKVELSEEKEYIVKIPTGRPRIPQIIKNKNFMVQQAFFQDGEEEAFAWVRNKESEYRVRFIKTNEKGMHLQYDDFYKFIPQKIKPKTFKSSNIDVAEVDENGNIHIVGVSDEGVIITAIDGEKEEKLIINKTVKSPLSIYLIAGQSNAAYYYVEPELAINTKSGTSYHYSEMTKNKNICSMNDSNGNMKIGNIEASLCKHLYEYTGEKTLVINAGVSGKSIETFIPNHGESYVYMKEIWNNVCNKLYDENFMKCYEINLKDYIWAQGESDESTDISKYEEYYLKLHKKLTSKQYGFNKGLIIKVRDNYINPSLAQEFLAEENENIEIVTRIADEFSVDNGKMRTDDLHYSQLGDNLLGEEIAKSIVELRYKVYK